MIPFYSIADSVDFLLVLNHEVPTLVSSCLSNTMSQRMVVQDPKKFAFMYLHISHLHLYHAWVCFFKSIYIVFFLLACESLYVIFSDLPKRWFCGLYYNKLKPLHAFCLPKLFNGIACKHVASSMVSPLWEEDGFVVWSKILIDWGI